MVLEPDTLAECLPPPGQGCPRLKEHAGQECARTGSRRRMEGSSACRGEELCQPLPAERLLKPNERGGRKLKRGTRRPRNTRSTLALEVLHGAFMGFSRLPCAEGSQVAPFSSLRVLLTRVQPVFSGLQFSNHFEPLNPLRQDVVFLPFVLPVSRSLQERHN